VGKISGWSNQCYSLEAFDDHRGPAWRYNYSVEYEEIYHGQHIIITTLQQAEGDWKSKAELLDSGKRIPLGMGSDDRYSFEEEARRAALSVAAAAIDRTRIARGKP
jgi:hypothetical protein